MSNCVYAKHENRYRNVWIPLWIFAYQVHPSWNHIILQPPYLLASIAPAHFNSSPSFYPQWSCHSNISYLFLVLSVLHASDHIGSQNSCTLKLGEFISGGIMHFFMFSNVDYLGHCYQASQHYFLQAFGHTPLTAISPKKTLEGAFAGLCGCTIVAIILSKFFHWPTSLLRYRPKNLEIAVLLSFILYSCFNFLCFRRIFGQVHYIVRIYSLYPVLLVIFCLHTHRH